VKTLTNAAGCDSTATLVLTINSSSSGSQSATACNSYTWQGTTYTASGTYVKTLTNAAGCDSVANLLLVINPSTTTTVTKNACGSFSWNVTGNTYTQSGTYTSISGCDTNILNLTITSCSITLELTAFLEGYYTGSGTMQSVLMNQGVSGATGAETDTVYIELRDATDPSVIIDTEPMLLMMDGTGSATFDSVNAGASCYIVLRHRMSIQTWSASPVLLSPVTTYEFWSDATQAYGGNLKEMETGIWAIYSGDMNQDEFVDPFDFALYLDDSINFASGYYATDLNGDGFVDPFDFSTYVDNSLNFILSAHP
jgi:hypothetical protein